MILGECCQATGCSLRSRRTFRLHTRWAAAGLLPAGLAALGLGCAQNPKTVPGDRGPAWEAHVETARSPSSDERYCSWFGDARGGVLYFGEAAFWSAYHRFQGDPRADLKQTGPQRIGRFDLAEQRLLAPLEVAAGGARSGVWDLLAHPNGRIYFTSYFEGGGYVDPESGAVVLPGDMGPGLNEIALGPGQTLLISRYGRPHADADADGAVLVYDADGKLLRELPLEPPPGFRVAPKSVAYDRLRDEIWVTTDLLPADGGRVERHDTYRLDASGQQKARIEQPEIQFVAFAPDGTGYWAEREGNRLWVRIIPPDATNTSVDSGLRVTLTEDFAGDFDFVQDIKISEDGRAVLTRWSGWVHVAEPTGIVRSLQLPRLDSEGLYYTGVLSNGQVCATHCADVTVVCRPAP